MEMHETVFLAAQEWINQVLEEAAQGKLRENSEGDSSLPKHFVFIPR